uniref:MSDIN-like toxin proprotein 5 n=1 Tax=Amanita exitialis TaxID=262245 RepID=MSD5_AMAEX|nr:RecName: Full=MSDIN-like toxin proprotein 5; Contains: RecName: Full=Toxin MSD5; Flags: Precursor [Amanita exitialis]AGW83706.1 MSDIN_like 5 peptide 5 [Amanita exitialis]
MSDINATRLPLFFPPDFRPPCVGDADNFTLTRGENLC